MRIFEILEESARSRFFQNTQPDYDYDYDNRPRLTLLDLRKMRRQRDKEKQERQEHLAFLPIMYADPIEPAKEKRKAKSNDKVAKLAQKTAMQIVKAEDKQETEAGKAALSWITTGH